jgi:hypothetical protein
MGQRHRIRVPLKSLIYDDYGFWNKKLHLQYYKFQDREIGILWRLTNMDSVYSSAAALPLSQL